MSGIHKIAILGGGQMGAGIAEAAASLERACREARRDPASIERSMWIFARPGRDPGDPALRAEFRRWNPWFARQWMRSLAKAPRKRSLARSRVGTLLPSHASSRRSRAGTPPWRST